MLNVINSFYKWFHWSTGEIFSNKLLIFVSQYGRFFRAVRIKLPVVCRWFFIRIQVYSRVLEYRSYFFVNKWIWHDWPLATLCRTLLYTSSNSRQLDGGNSWVSGVLIMIWKWLAFTIWHESCSRRLARSFLAMVDDFHVNICMMLSPVISIYVDRKPPEMLVMWKFYKFYKHNLFSNLNHKKAFLSTKPCL